MVSEELKLFLGFDGECGECRRIANTVQERVGDRIDVIPLADQRMVRWRQKLLRKQHWLPTLVATDGDKDRAWLGAVMAPALVKFLGLRDSLSVLSAIGRDRLRRGKAKSDAYAYDNDPSSRRGFMRLAAGVSGAIAGSVMVAGMVRPAIASPVRVKNLAVTSQRAIPPNTVLQTFEEHLLDSDASNVLRGASGRFKELIRSSGQTRAEVGGRTYNLKNGTEMVSTYAYAADEQRLLINQVSSKPISGEKTASWLVEVIEDEQDFGNTSVRIIEHSVNGELVQKLDTEEIAAENDPCGGCTGGVCKTGGKELRESCYSSNVASCILSVAGCATCLGCSGTGGCISCAILSCSGVLLSCCDKHVGPSCRACQRVC